MPRLDPSVVPPSLTAPLAPPAGLGGAPDLGTLLGGIQAQIAAAITPLLALQDALTRQLAAAEATQQRAEATHQRMEASMREMGDLRLEMRAALARPKRTVSMARETTTSGSESECRSEGSQSTMPQAAAPRRAHKTGRSSPPNA